MTTATNPTQPWYNKTGLVIFLCIFLFPIGLYALWRSPKYSKGWKFTGTALIGLFVILAATDKTKATDHPKSEATAEKPAETKPAPASDPEPATAASEDKPTSTDESNKSAKYLFASADDFKDAFNKYCTSNNQDFNIDELTIKEGEVQNVFQYMFTEHLGLLGTIRKTDGKLTEINMLGSGDGTLKSGSDIILCMFCLIATVDPGLEPSKRGDILKNLGILGKDADITNLDGKTERNGFKYSVASSKMMGLMFSISRE